LPEAGIRGRLAEPKAAVLVFILVEVYFL
jgi:hypothetical protein